MDHLCLNGDSDNILTCNLLLQSLPLPSDGICMEPHNRRRYLCSRRSYHFVCLVSFGYCVRFIFCIQFLWSGLSRWTQGPRFLCLEFSPSASCKLLFYLSICVCIISKITIVPVSLPSHGLEPFWVLMTIVTIFVRCVQILFPLSCRFSANISTQML
jgi:hypothetical protein